MWVACKKSNTKIQSNWKGKYNRYKSYENYTFIKMQPTIHLERKTINLALPSQSIVGCIFSSIRLIVITEISCIDKKKILKYSMYIEL
jgi:hypothetical protein